MNKKLVKIIIGIVILILLDFLTKVLIIHSFNLNEGIIIINNFLKFIYIRNTGAAFGILGKSTILLVIITVALLTYLIFEIIKSKSNLNTFAYLLIISGAIGNLIDRIFRGYVIDFISFTLFGREMAIFNIADIYITFGIILFIYNVFKEDRNERNNRK